MKTVSEVYPSQWVHVDDLKGRSVMVTIERAVVEAVRQRDGDNLPKIVLSLAKTEKRLICNKSQAVKLTEICGTEEFARWSGTKIVLSPGRAANGKPTIVITAPAQETQA